MRNTRMLTRCRAAILAAVAVLGLGGCEGDSTGSSVLLGTWEAQVGSGEQRVEYRLEITPTRYLWTELYFGTGGRPEDGLRERTTRGGEWQVRGDRLALYVGGMSIWSHPSGEWIVDFQPWWDDNNYIASLQGNEMTIEHRPPPEQSFRRPTLEFRRVR